MTESLKTTTASRDELEREVTERKQAEEALRDSEEMSRGMIESAAAGIYIVQEGKFRYVSPPLEEISGYTSDELIGTYSLDHIHPEDREMVRNKAIENLKGRSNTPHEFRFIRKDGETIWALEKIASIQYKGERATIGSLVDITERQQMQERLVRSEKLAVLGQLGAGVSHELRNPLGAIKNAAYFLNMALEEPEPEVKETLEILEKEVATCERIISSLLDFARAKSPARRKVDINDVVQEALSRNSVPENVQVVSQLGGALPAIFADPDHLVQVFGNIMLNAVQAMPQGGRLVVKSEAPGPGRVAVSVADTGAGIPEENLGKLFEPLFTTKAKGIGLGLALVKTMVEGHGGSIEVQSEVGQGTTFTVRLPLGMRKED